MHHPLGGQTVRTRPTLPPLCVPRRICRQGSFKRRTESVGRTRLEGRWKQTYLTSPACVRKLARTWNKMPGFVVFCPSAPSTGILIKGHNTAALARFTSRGAVQPLAASLNASWTRRSVFGVSGQEGLMIACWVNVGLGKVEYARRGTNDMVGDEMEKRNAILLGSYGSYGKERGRFIAQGPAHYINSTISLTTKHCSIRLLCPPPVSIIALSH